eukprot:1337080-Pyramimonas_sp.AAC.1
MGQHIGFHPSGCTLKAMQCWARLDQGGARLENNGYALYTGDSSLEVGLAEQRAEGASVSNGVLTPVQMPS